MGAESAVLADSVRGARQEAVIPAAQA